MTEIDTKTATHRSLKFQTVDDVMQELDRIAAADSAGSLKTNGNWTPGQNLSHLAAWIEYGYNGFPLKAPPFFVRWILKRMMKKTLANGMSPGMKIPGVPGGTTGQEDMETGAAIERYKAALLRMQSEPAIYDSPAFGKVPDDVRIKMMLIHAELHLGFLEY